MEIVITAAEHRAAIALLDVLPTQMEPQLALDNALPDVLDRPGQAPRGRDCLGDHGIFWDHGVFHRAGCWHE